MNFDLSTWKSKTFSFQWAPFEQSLYCLSWKFTEELSFMTLKSDAKFEEKLTCGLENDMRNMANFHQSNWKSQNWDIDGLIKSKKSMSLKSTEELSVMTMKNDAKFEEQLTCHFKVDMRNLTNFNQSTLKSQMFSFNVILLSKVYIVWVIYRVVIFHKIE